MENTVWLQYLELISIIITCLKLTFICATIYLVIAGAGSLIRKISTILFHIMTAINNFYDEWLDYKQVKSELIPNSDTNKKRDKLYG